MRVPCINYKPSVGVGCGMKRRGMSVQMTDRLLEDLLPSAWAYICPWGKQECRTWGNLWPQYFPKELENNSSRQQEGNSFLGVSMSSGCSTWHNAACYPRVLVPETIAQRCDAARSQESAVLCIYARGSCLPPPPASL